MGCVALSPSGEVLLRGGCATCFIEAAGADRFMTCPTQHGVDCIPRNARPTRYMAPVICRAPDRRCYHSGARTGSATLYSPARTAADSMPWRSNADEQCAHSATISRAKTVYLYLHGPAYIERAVV